MKKEMKNLCEQIPGYQQLRTIPGCGLITAAVMLAEIMDISRFKSADALISYAGTDPVNKRSGSSVHTEGQISRKGSRYLRYALIVFAEIARRHNPVLKELFERLKAGQRKRHYLALVAVANKLVRYVYSVLKNQCEFVINFKDLIKLKEETRTTFFQNVRGEIKAFKMGVLRFNSFGEITVQSRNHLSILGALFINALGEISIAIRMK